MDGFQTTVSVVFLCLFFAYRGCYPDTRANRANEPHTTAQAREPRGKIYPNGTGTKVKFFIDWLISNYTAGRKIRRHSRRICRALSAERLNLLYYDLPKYLYSRERLLHGGRQVVMEVGFGDGEHLIHQAKLKPKTLFFGIDAFLNGVAGALKLAKNENVTNILMFPDLLAYVFDDIPDGSISYVYILFPDPWMKGNKKAQLRFVNKAFLETLPKKLRRPAGFVFATDIDDYGEEVTALIAEGKQFEITNKGDYSREPENYITTKYHEKALSENRQVKFIHCKTID